jgi:hypothetical protein
MKPAGILQDQRWRVPAVLCGVLAGGNSGAPARPGPPFTLTIVPVLLDGSKPH